MYRFLSRLVSVLFVALSIGALAGRTCAQERPYFATGGAQFVNRTDFVGTGNATHLGRYTEAGSVSFTPTGNPDVVTVRGRSIYTAADGDELHAVIVGQLNTVTGVIVATVTYAGGTGRFSAARGSSDLAGQMLGGGAVSASLAGTIEY